MDDRGAAIEIHSLFPYCTQGEEGYKKAANMLSVGTAKKKC